MKRRCRLRVKISRAQAEDFFFYTVRPGNFPKYSRYQFPIFETEVEPVHFTNAAAGAGPNSLQRITISGQTRTSPKTRFHYVEFKNPTQYPFTTGAANILSESDGVTYPLSQDKLPYTPPTAKCKVKIAQSRNKGHARRRRRGTQGKHLPVFQP